MIKYHYEIEQNTDSWLKLKRGVLTASNICKILTPSRLEISKATGYLYEFCRQLVDDMPYGDFSTRHTDRGLVEECFALQTYEANFGGLKRCGFVENTRHGFKIGCSPDALVGEEGGVQVKSFTPNAQFGNIVEDRIEACHLLQVQMELFVTERAWWDVIYQSSGTHQIVTRVYPDEEKQGKIKEACSDFYSRVEIAMQTYRQKLTDAKRFFPTPPVEGLYNQPVEGIFV